jgi:hypothetical protein
MNRLLVALALATGCAGAGVAVPDRGETQWIGDRRPFNVLPLQLARVHEGDLAMREPSRLSPWPSRMALEQRLDRAFVGELGRYVSVQADAPLTIVPTLTLGGIAPYEGLAPETADTVLEVRLVDGAGFVVDDVVLNARANAPLARRGSRDERLEDAVRRLADRYAARLPR